MKLLTTIAAVLISISAFSQDYVEYNEGTFSSNGKELSLDKVELIMKQYRVPFYRARLQSVKKQIRNCENKFRRVGMLSLSIIETPVLALGTGLFGLFSLVSADSGDMVGAVGFGVITVGLASATAYFPHLAYVHSTKDRCQNKVDKLCEKLVEKLNKKIEAKYKLLGY
ncbi:hypothetical protein OAP05_02500 [Schleiferiaceae bacterium]|nr:hypothetical protein [Schleiferiaceae bacterium]